MDPDDFMEHAMSELNKRIEQGALPEPYFGVMEPYVDMTDNEGELICGIEVKFGFPSIGDAPDVYRFGPTQVLTVGMDKIFLPNDNDEFHFPFYCSEDINDSTAPVKKDLEGYIQLAPGPYVRTNFSKVTEVKDLPQGYSIMVGQRIEDCIEELLKVMGLRIPRQLNRLLN
ncbi:hypothetical protein HZB03_04425 [Candidatus Woesearchaeota archaeon]|nr:hypothetical protein [Candidatus Woesearchaeota archaeon]